VAETSEKLMIVLEGTDTSRPPAEGNLRAIADYQAAGGYEMLAQARKTEPAKVIEELLAADLKGRGGAGFPMGRKASFIPVDSPRPKYLTINADESEPGTFKDREIMLRVPHRLIEGALITIHAIGSKTAFIYIRGEDLEEFEVLRAALDEARDAGLLGDATVVLHRGAGAYICGEETALLESLEGKRGQPRSKPPFPAIAGLYASPTLINNVETIATVPAIVRNGGAWYASKGVEGSAGTRVFSLSGNVVKGGNYELELGTPMAELILRVGGGIAGGRKLKAVIPGGSSVPVLTAEEALGSTLDYNAMSALGTFLGSGAVIVIDDRACMVQLGLRVAQFYQHESCGKCTPCREGTRWMVQILHAIENGEATQGQLDLLLDVCDRILGKCLCPLGDAAAMPVASYIDKFRDEFQAHVDAGRCPYEGESSLDRIFAPVDQHRHHPTVELPS
jgi:NADH-quinone oxidoreductase subunit F